MAREDDIMSNNDITVIVAIYNVEKYVKKCLDSLLNQTYKNFEVYAVIDGSPDNSVEIVKEYAAMDSRIKCIEKENGGYGSVLEYSIKNMKSKYFLICDPDDWLAPNALEVLHENAEKYDADIVVGDKYFVYNDNGEQKYCSSIRDYNIMSGVVYEGQSASIISSLHVSPHSKLYKTEVAKNIIFPKKVSYTDYLLYIITCSRATRTLYIKGALSYYLIDRPGNSVTDTSLKSAKSIMTVFSSACSQVNSNKYIFYELYCGFKWNVINTISRLNKNDYKIVKPEIFNLVDLLLPYKKEINDCIKHQKFIKHIYNKTIFNMLINKKTRQMAINFLIKRERKKTNEI